MGTASMKCGRCNQKNRKYRMYCVKTSERKQVLYPDIPNGFYCKHCMGVMRG